MKMPVKVMFEYDKKPKKFPKDGDVVDTEISFTIHDRYLEWEFLKEFTLTARGHTNRLRIESVYGDLIGSVVFDVVFQTTIYDLFDGESITIHPRSRK